MKISLRNRNFYRLYLFTVHILFFHLLISFSALSQKITGKVVSNNEPVAGATILLREDSAGAIKGYSVSNEQGVYIINYQGNKKNVFLEVTSVGFNKIRIPLSLISDREVVFDFLLTSTDVMLPEVVIRTEPAVSIRGDTTIYKIDSFVNGNENSLLDAIDKIPGFYRSASGILVYNGKPINRILVENDDLLGSNYSQLLENLTINGIDKLEVIQNHQDPDNILSNNKEQVLNLKYKKGFLSKTFGEAYFSQGIPARYRSGGGQAISIFPKLRFILFSETGNTWPPLNLKIYTPVLQENASEILLPHPALLSNIAEPRAITFQEGFINRQFSSASKLNARLNLNKKVSIYGNIGINHLKSDHKFESYRTFLSIQDPVTITDFSEVRKKQAWVTPGFSINYLPTKKSQLIFTVAGAMNPFDFINDINYQGTAQSESRDGANNQVALKLLYNQKWKVVNISMENRYVRSRITGDFLNMNSSLLPFFGYSITDASASQHERLSSHEWRSKFILYYKGWSFRSNLGINRHATRNDIIFMNGFEVQSVSRDSLVHSKYDQTSIDFTVGRQISLRKLSITPAIGIARFWNRNRSLSKDLVESERKAPILPELLLEYRFGNEKQIALKYQTSVVQPSPVSIAKGFYIHNLGSIFESAGLLNTRTAHTASLFYFYNGIQKKSILFNLGLLYSNNPMNTIEILYPSFFYSFNKTAYFKREMISQSFISTIEKFLPGSLRMISHRLNLSRISNYSSIEGRLQKNIMFVMQTGVKLQFRMASTSILLNNEYQVFHLEVLENNTTTSTSKFTISAYVEQKIGRNLFVAGKMTSHFVFPGRQPVQKLSYLESRITYHTKNKKWQFELAANNILNQDHFTVTSIYPTQTHKTTYELFPRSLSGVVKYKF